MSLDSDSFPYRADLRWLADEASDEDLRYEENRFLVRNLLADWRITKERADSLAEVLDSHDVGLSAPKTRDRATRVIQGLHTYHTLRVQQATNETTEFQVYDFNGPNMIRGNKVPPDKRDHRERTLGRLLRINHEGVFDTLRRSPDRTAYQALSNDFGELFQSSKTYVDEMAAIVFDPKPGESEAENGSRVGKFVCRVLEVLDQASSKHPYEPTWATCWHSLERHLGKDDFFSTEEHHFSVGKPAQRNSCVVVLKYQLDSTEPLVRPTQLDAGGNHGVPLNVWHFPSPKNRPVPDGGCPAYLGDDARILSRCSHDDRLIPEFIHLARRYQPNEVVYFDVVPDDQLPDLLSIRRNHYQRLVNKYRKEHITEYYPEVWIS